MPFTNSSAGKTLAQMVHEVICGNDNFLRENFASSGAPDTPLNGQLWADTGTGYLKIRHVGAWHVVGPLTGNAHRILTPIKVGAVNATAEVPLLILPCNAQIVRIGILSDTTTVSSEGVSWSFLLKNVTQGNNLFSGTPTTLTEVSGVGGGTDVASWTAYWLTVNQNAEAFEDDCLSLLFTKTGSATTMANVTIVVDAYETPAT